MNIQTLAAFQQHLQPARSALEVDVDQTYSQIDSATAARPRARVPELGAGQQQFELVAIDRDVPTGGRRVFDWLNRLLKFP